MARVLIEYATSEGQTARIAARVAERLRAAGHAAELHEMRPGAPAAEVERYDGVIVGASVHYGHHPAHVRTVLRRQRVALAVRPAAFFSVSLSADGPGANRPAAQRYMRRLLRQARWQPHLIATFGGALRYREYAAWKRFLVRLFVRIAGGDTDTSREYEYTDWNAVAQFADAFAARLGNSS